MNYYNEINNELINKLGKDYYEKMFLISKRAASSYPIDMELLHNTITIKDNNSISYYT